MNVLDMKKQCLWCGRFYKETSRPLWAFDGDLILQGTLHSSHADLWRKAIGLPDIHSCIDVSVSPEYARRVVWARGSTWTLYEKVLFYDPDRRNEHLEWWTTHNPGKWKEADVEGLLDRVRGMESQYLAQFPEPLEDNQR